MGTWLRLAAVIFSCSLFLYAQSSTGTLTGIVTDPSKANLPSVSIDLVNQATGVAESVVTNQLGEYTFSLLQPGSYKLTAQANGFRTYTHPDIVMESARTTRIDISMEIGAVKDTIEVSASPSLLESESATVGQFIENKIVTDMPLTGRRVGELLALEGNSVFITGDVIRPRVAIAGGRADQQQWLIDGVNTSNIAFEVPQALFNPPVEAVQEIRLQQNAYSAEYGNTSSGVVAMTTRSGSNEWHGSAYEFFRNDALDARNFFANQKAPLRWNIFGFSASGPIRHNRTFFFVNTEWQKERVGATQTFTVPTAAQRAGDFSQTFTAAGALVPIYDPTTTAADPAHPGQVTRTVYPGNKVPASQIDPVGAALLALYPLPNQTPTNRAGANNFTGSNVTALNLTTITAKVDHQFRETDRATVRFLLHDFPTSTSATFLTAAADPNAVNSPRRAYSTLIEEIHTFSPSLLNDARYEWQPRYFYSNSLGLGQGWPTKLGLKGVPDTSFPRVTAAGFTAMGPGTQQRIQTPIHDTDIVDVLSWFHGSHSMKFGGEYRYVRDVDILNDIISGSLAFTTQETGLPGNTNSGNAIASELVGAPNSASIHATLPLDRRAAYIGAFVQDDWKVTRNFTLNLGLRWEAHTPRIDVRNRQNGFNTTAINPVSGTPGVVTFAGLNGLGQHVYNGDWNNFGPRVGLAWKPFDLKKTVIRSGFGVFYGPPLEGSNNTSAGFESTGSFSSPDNGITPPFLLRSGFPGGASQSSLGPGYGAVPVGSAVIFSPTFLEQNRQLGYTEQWNFTIQQDVGFDTLIEAAYMGVAGHRLPGPDTNMNQVPPALMGPGNAQVRRPFPQFGNVNIVAPMWGNSNYQSFNLKVEKRFSHGLNLLANYTWAKFIDDVPASFEAGASTGAGTSNEMQNFYNRQAEKALSGNDIPHRFVLSSTYEFPIGKGKRWLSSGIGSSLIGGWTLGFITLLQHGAPEGLVTQTNTTNAFTPGPQRVNVLRDPNLPSGQQTVAEWFDVNAVVAPAAYTFGSAPRSLVWTPGLIDVSASLLKNFKIRERFNFQFRAESLNVLNHANFMPPGNALGAATFGVISAARDGRIMQLGLRMDF